MLECEKWRILVFWSDKSRIMIRHIWHLDMPEVHCPSGSSDPSKHSATGEGIMIHELKCKYPMYQSPRKRIFTIIFILFILISGCATIIGPERSIEKAYQAKADKQRIQDVKTIAFLINKFQKKTGYCPMADGKYPLPVNVPITHRKKYQDPGRIQGMVSFATFEEELKRVLGGSISIPMDPQRVPVYGSRLYQYFTDGENCSVAAYLFKGTPLTWKLGKYTHKYELHSKRQSDPIVILQFSQLPEGTQVLIHAITKEDIDGIKAALSKEPELDPVCSLHMICKPLAWAAETNNLEIVELLIEAGADPNGQNAFKNTPLQYTVMSPENSKGLTAKSIEVMSYLIEHGADVNKPNAWGRTPFIVFCAVGNMELIKYSLAHGADVNAAYSAYWTKSAGRITSLMFAAEFGQAEVVELLLSKGADPELRNSDGKTALDLAIKNRHEAIIKLLQAHSNKE